MHQIPDLPLPVRYLPAVTRELLHHGVVPTRKTQPRMIYQFLRALMTFEIRDRKARRRELERFLGPQPLDDYARQIEELRARYSLLRRHPREWVETAAGGGGNPAG